MAAFQAAALVASCSFALVGGALAALGICERREREARRRKASGASGLLAGRLEGDGLAARIVAYACAVERRLSFGASGRVAPRRFASSARLRSDVEQRACRAGVVGRIGPDGYREAQVRLAFVGACAGALVGSVLSTELAALLGVAGLMLGAASVRRSMDVLALQRLMDLERDLPEMLEVVALGLRSGLSFDKSFALYHEHFDTAFSRECASAQRRWTLGLSSRDDALGQLARCYESTLLQRTVDAMVRSLRFGASLAETLESQAGEARAVRKARREEQVAKAPVKMMIPTGALILPAMLLLVLGPVLLELMEGF